MPPTGPAYELRELIAACGRSGEVKVLKTAMDGAADLGLHCEDDVLEWIANGAILKEEHQNTEPWRNNPDPAVPIMVDSYNFYNNFNMSDYVYLAFMYQPKTRKWLIKSLKKSDKNPPRVFLLAQRLRDAGFE